MLLPVLAGLHVDSAPSPSIRRPSVQSCLQSSPHLTSPDALCPLPSLCCLTDSPHLTPPDAHHLLPSPHSHRLSSPDCKGLQPSVPILKPWILHAPWFLHVSLWSEGSNSLIHCVPHVPPASPTTAGLRDSLGAGGAACVHESQCLTQRTPAHPLAPPQHHVAQDCPSHPLAPPGSRTLPLLHLRPQPHIR